MTGLVFDNTRTAEKQTTTHTRERRLGKEILRQTSFRNLKGTGRMCNTNGRHSVRDEERDDGVTEWGFVTTLTR